MNNMHKNIGHYRLERLKRGGYKLLSVFSMSVLIFNMSLMGVFFVGSGVEAADTTFKSPSANVQNGSGDDWDHPTRAYSDNTEYASEQNGEKHRYYITILTLAYQQAQR